MPVEPTDWLSLVHQTNDLVSQDRHGYPKVQRDLAGLLVSSQSARARTSRVRSVAEQAAATRLLATQGFDAGRLNQDVAMLELQPTLEEIFHADTTSVDDYLQQVQDMSILTAIQEAQQDTISTFERHMADCSAREWASDKAGLLASIAPHTGLGGAGAGGAAGALSFGSLARADAGATQGPREQAYVAVVKQLAAAAAAAGAAAAGGPTLGPIPTGTVDPVSAFGAACEQYEEKSTETLMSSCWKLLGDVLGGARAAGAAPGQDLDYIDALLQGARGHLQSGFRGHMRAAISRHRGAAQRGADPDPLRDVQAYVAVRFRDRGTLDLQAAGGMDTSWSQVFFALRAGLTDAALRAAERAVDTSQPRAAPTSLRPLLAQWLADSAGVRAKHGARLAQECERLLQGRGAKQVQGQLKSDHAVLVYGLMAGDARSLDTLFKLNPSLLPTMEDFVWAKLTLVNVHASAGSSAGIGASPGASTAYSLSALQTELNRWGARYYSKDGREPLLYLTVLLLSLQFRRGLAFLLRADMAKPYRLDGVHMAVALQYSGVLSAATDDPAAGAPLELDLAASLAAFGRRYVAGDSATALHYYMLAAAAAGGGLREQGALFRELLVASGDYGTLLGAGGPAGPGGALSAFVPDPEARGRLLESVAYECEAAGQPEDARELFMAARRPRAALRIVNRQLSAAIHDTRGALTEAMSSLLSRGQAAAEAIASAPDAGSRREAGAFQQLQLVRELLELTGNGAWDRALQVAAKLSFLPSERARIEVCKLEVRQLDEAVRERLSDVLSAVAECALRLRVNADGALVGLLRERVACLKVFVLDLDPSITPAVYERINACVREFA